MAFYNMSKKIIKTSWENVLAFRYIKLKENIFMYFITVLLIN